jgi:hypothetical protein
MKNGTSQIKTPNEKNQNSIVAQKSSCTVTFVKALKNVSLSTHANGRRNNATTDFTHRVGMVSGNARAMVARSFVVCFDRRLRDAISATHYGDPLIKSDIDVA